MVLKYLFGLIPVNVQQSLNTSQSHTYQTNTGIISNFEVKVRMTQNVSIGSFTHYENRVLLKPVLGAWPMLHILILVIKRFI